jgi:hypothetical protein
MTAISTPRATASDLAANLLPDLPTIPDAEQERTERLANAF